MSKGIKWTNPLNIDLTKEKGVLYFIEVIDNEGKEYRYIGKTKRGKSRLGEYVNNVQRIFRGQPRRTTPGQEKYRPVHLALAKACEYGWEYKFYPIENVDIEDLNALEQQRIRELNCGLNIKWSWIVDEFDKLGMSDIGRTR